MAARATRPKRGSRHAKTSWALSSCNSTWCISSGARRMFHNCHRGAQWCVTFVVTQQEAGCCEVFGRKNILQSPQPEAVARTGTRTARVGVTHLLSCRNTAHQVAKQRISSIELVRLDEDVLRRPNQLLHEVQDVFVHAAVRVTDKTQEECRRSPEALPERHSRVAQTKACVDCVHALTPHLKTQCSTSQRFLLMGNGSCICCERRVAPSLRE